MKRVKLNIDPSSSILSPGGRAVARAAEGLLRDAEKTTRPKYVHRPRQRVTWDVLAAGQPRPYANTIRRVRVVFEHAQAKTEDWVPNYMNEELAIILLEQLPVSFTKTKKHELGENWHWPYLVYLRPEDPKTAAEVISHGDPDETVGSIWIFETHAEYTG